LEPNPGRPLSCRPPRAPPGHPFCPPTGQQQHLHPVLLSTSRAPFSLQRPSSAFACLKLGLLSPHFACAPLLFYALFGASRMTGTVRSSLGIFFFHGLDSRHTFLDPKYSGLPQCAFLEFAPLSIFARKKGGLLSWFFLYRHFLSSRTHLLQSHRAFKKFPSASVPDSPLLIPGSLE